MENYQMFAVLDDKVYIAQSVIDVPDCFCRFVTGGVRYEPFCDDFGPMNLSSVVHFIEELRDAIQANPDRRIVYCIDEGVRSMTNGVFLLGTYMIIALEMSTTDVLEHFDWVTDDICEPYRDATYTTADFRLRLVDCWRGLERAKSHGWIQYTDDGEEWGDINIAEYRHYDQPGNGDFHEVVPGKMVAFRGPFDLDGTNYHDDDDGLRNFSPDYFADIFAADFNIKAVVRLNHNQYDPTSFNRAGIRHHDLPFQDCTAPPPHIVAAFLAIADSAFEQGGAVAVHCRAGLGRTGTLIALYMMRSLGFSAREAMGWLRIARPGSVIGKQQHFLCAVEDGLGGVMGWLTGGSRGLPTSVSTPAGVEKADSEWEQRRVRDEEEKGADLGEVVAWGTERRAALRMRPSI